MSTPRCRREVSPGHRTKYGYDARSGMRAATLAGGVDAYGYDYAAVTLGDVVFDIESGDVDVDLGRLFGSLAAHWKRILFVALAVTALALAFAWAATPRYRGETRILIETRESAWRPPPPDWR